MMMREDARAGGAPMTPISRDMDASRSRKGTTNTLSLMMREDARAGGAPQTPVARSIEDVRPGKDEYDERNRLLREDIEAGGNKGSAAEDKKKKERQEHEKRELRRQDSVKTGYTPFTLYSNMDYAVEGASSVLNWTTALENKESCCNLYSTVIDGKTHCFTGEVFVGNQFDVVVPYLADALWEKNSVQKNGLLGRRDVQYEGFIHAHPYNEGSNKFSGGVGDAAVALLSGNIFLTAPDGSVYRLSRPDALMEDKRTSFARLLTAALANQPPAPDDVTQYLDAVRALRRWYANPPETPYGTVRSLDTTQISTWDNNITHDTANVIRQLLDRYAERHSDFMDNLYRQGLGYPVLKPMT